jgi:hypothetical protein
MAFQLSPGVLVTEEDRSTVVPSVATTAGAFSGAFVWGPANQVTTIDSEGKLVETFGKPNDTTAGYFFTAANFLSYGNNLQIVRAINKGAAKNAVSEPSGSVTGVTLTSTEYVLATSGSAVVTFSASPTGNTAAGNVTLTSNAVLRSISLSTTGFGYSQPPTVVVTGGGGSTSTATATLGSGRVETITVTNAGNNYTTLSNVVIQNQESTSASANLEVHFKLRDIQITNGGTNYGPFGVGCNVVVSGGTLVAGGSHANVQPIITGNVVTGFTILDSGNGYISAPTITINRLDGNTGTDVVLTANLGYGYINRITVLNKGEGGYSFTPNVTINRNNSLGGTSATATARLAAEISTIGINSAAGDYTSTPNVIITPDSSDIPFLTSNATAVAIMGYGVASVNILNSGSGYNTAPSVIITEASNPNSIAAEGQVNINFNNPLIENSEDYLANHSTGGFGYGVFASKYPGSLGNGILVSMADSATFTGWTYASLFASAPATSTDVSARGGSNDELHIIVIDTLGTFSGSPNSVLEKFSFVSKASDGKNSDQSTNYYKDVIANQSRYIWVLDHPTGTTNWGTTGSSKSFNVLTNPYQYVLTQGASGDNVSTANVLEGYTLFSNDELYDVSLIPMGPTTAVSAVNNVIGIAESRRDCMVFVSPPYTDVVNTTGQAGKVTTYRDTLTNTSFAVLDSGWKYQYDRYNDKYRYVPLNGDVAGLAARTDYIADPWFSPAGYDRGVIKNVVKLAWSPSKTDRDTLYKKGVNPVVTFPGQGTLLFGDKTLLARPSAFDRINVRRLFIVLEKAIATAAKFQLFEFNDAFTQAQFRNLVEPFLRDVQGRRGITDFRVICDDTNNTPEVIDRNEFVADIFIKPARAINYIQLNFIATRSGISFEEVGA